MKKEAPKTKDSSFGFRIKIGDYEVEITGAREEVLKTLTELPNLINAVNKAFETAKPKTVATLTVKTEPAKQETHGQSFPKILPTTSNEEAVTRILETDWGKWRPRTINELKEALRANGFNFSEKSLTEVLLKLVKKGAIRRWNTDAGFVYILAENEAVRPRSETP
ncbi:MAG: hypothetical protein QW840_00685 [Candidatus Bathyarchaeia archaeon]